MNSITDAIRRGEYSRGVALPTTPESSYWQIATSPNKPLIEGKAWNRYRERVAKDILTDANKAFPELATQSLEIMIESLHLFGRVRSEIRIDTTHGALCMARPDIATQGSEYIFRPSSQEHQKKKADPHRKAVRTLSVNVPALEYEATATEDDLAKKAIDEVLKTWLCFAQILIKNYNGTIVNDSNIIKNAAPKEGFMNKDIDPVGIRMFLLAQMVEHFDIDCEFYAMQKRAEERDAANGDKSSLEAVKKIEKQMSGLVKDCEHEIVEKDEEIAKLHAQLAQRALEDINLVKKSGELETLQQKLHKVSKENEHLRRLVKETLPKIAPQGDISAGNNESRAVEAASPCPETSAKEEGYPYIDYSLQYLFPLNPHMNVEPDLHRLFPNARFIHSCNEAFPTGTDYIVFIADIISHTLYTKYKDKCDYIHCPHANVEQIQGIMNEFFKARAKAKKEA